MADPMTAPSGEAIRQLIDRAKAYIFALVNHGAEVCGTFTPKPEMTGWCAKCGYSECTHVYKELAALDAYARLLETPKIHDGIGCVDGPCVCGHCDCEHFGGWLNGATSCRRCACKTFTAVQFPGARETPPMSPTIEEVTGIVDLGNLKDRMNDLRGPAAPAHAEPPTPRRTGRQESTITGPVVTYVDGQRQDSLDELRAALARMTEERDTLSLQASKTCESYGALAALREAASDAVIAFDRIGWDRHACDIVTQIDALRALLPPPERGEKGPR